jgi:ketosteroid isomerase-like protein
MDNSVDLGGRRIIKKLLVTPLPLAAQFVGPDAEAVRARETAFAQTMADRDLEAFLSFIDPGAVFFNGNEALRGIAAVEEAWSPFFEGPTAPFSWSPDLVQVLESGDLALSSGPVMTPSGEEVGRFNSIWRKDADGVWRVVFDKGS